MCVFVVDLWSVYENDDTILFKHGNIINIEEAFKISPIEGSLLIF